MSSKRTELICLWLAPVGVILFVVGWIMIQYLPSPPAQVSGTAIQALYLHHTTAIRIGLYVIATGSMLTLPFVVVVTSQMLRIEGPRGVLSYLQLALGTFGVVVEVMGLFPLAVAIYRPEISPQLVRLMADLFWIPYVICFWPYSAQVFAVGALALRKIPSNPLPRWYGWFSIVAGVFVATSLGVLFTKTGPFASSGWVPVGPSAAAYWGWTGVTVYLFHRLIVRAPEKEPERAAVRRGVVEEGVMEEGVALPS